MNLYLFSRARNLYNPLRLSIPCAFLIAGIMHVSYLYCRNAIKPSCSDGPKAPYGTKGPREMATRVGLAALYFLRKSGLLPWLCAAFMQLCKSRASVWRQSWAER
jgi:hypothetical protein